MLSEQRALKSGKGDISFLASRVALKKGWIEKKNVTNSSFVVVV
jgi:hypothetical protein